MQDPGVPSLVEPDSEAEPPIPATIQEYSWVKVDDTVRHSSSASLAHMAGISTGPNKYYLERVVVMTKFGFWYGKREEACC